MRVAPLILAASIGLPGIAHGCEIMGPPAGWQDPRIVVMSDCSFKEAGAAYQRDISGGPVLDLGGGRVGQRITEGQGCGYGEHLQVVDCRTGEMIGIEGQPWEVGTQGGTSVKLLYPPEGKVRLTATTTVADLAALSQTEGYRYWLDVTARIKAMKPRNRPDPTCGCRLFYPDSATN